ncbi:MAG: AmmeMemoRadiSam system protein B [Rhodoferax sp.]|uniref:AmmeMemoRadiSam system protein B n=1 Tax=Rhodoferax sp. TaxID=50421 RepID=UPI0026150A4B|nr:AmmeMemoRadiSam system protein B [Rhodoferax sp.]MDD5336369.1 AmmeMemoRadiSam system protein B [Rhodoferax sp.]
MHKVREPAVAGAFYPGRSSTLSSHVMALLANANTSTDNATAPKAIIVPHAGYIYSGATAALAYARLAAARTSIRRVILLGPVHRVAVRGLALPGVDYFATPLGQIEIDQAAVAAITPLRQVVVSPAAHAPEHSLEVQLPFLQAVLQDFKLVPLAVGDATPAEVAQVLEVLWGGAETLIVISSDLSHFLPYRAAQAVDQETVQNILAMDGALTHQQACGGTPVNGLLLAATRHHLRPQLLGHCNSGDTAGDKGRVVGYAAFAFMEPCGTDRSDTQCASSVPNILSDVGGPPCGTDRSDTRCASPVPNRMSGVERPPCGTDRSGRSTRTFLNTSGSHDVH